MMGEMMRKFILVLFFAIQAANSFALLYTVMVGKNWTDF